MKIFRAPVGPDIMLFDAPANALLTAMGKEASARGVITVEQLPAAIAVLDVLIAGRQGHLDANAPEAEADGDGPAISLAQRAIPLRDLLKIALAAGKPVTWGV